MFHPSRPNEVLCTSVTTLTDNVYEGTEYRGIVLTADADITIEPDVAVLEILDNNGWLVGGRGGGVTMSDAYL